MSSFNNKNNINGLYKMVNSELVINEDMENEFLK